MGRVCIGTIGRVGYVQSLLCAELIMCRVGFVLSLLCAELSHNCKNQVSKKLHKVEFFLRLNFADWGQCFNAFEANTAWSAFRDIFLSILNSVAPVKAVRLKQRIEHRSNSEILDLKALIITFIS